MADGSKIDLRPIPGYSGYSVSRDGVICGPRGVMAPMVAHRGHRYVLVKRPGVPRKLYVHRAVLLAWVGPPSAEAQLAIHGNDVPDDNRVENLRWGSRLDNAAGRQSNRGYARGEKVATAVLTEEQVVELRRRHPAESLRSLAAEFGVSHTAVRRAVNGMKWSHV